MGRKAEMSPEDGAVVWAAISKHLPQIAQRAVTAARLREAATHGASVADAFTDALDQALGRKRGGSHDPR